MATENIKDKGEMGIRPQRGSMSPTPLRARFRGLPLWHMSVSAGHIGVRDPHYTLQKIVNYVKTTDDPPSLGDFAGANALTSKYLPGTADCCVLYTHAL